MLIRFLSLCRTLCSVAQSTCATIDGVNDVTAFGELVASLTDLGVTEADQQQLFQLLAGLLLLG